jgi:hypothetical protein
VFDKEEKEELDNKEVDKLILNSLCGKIMDVVMDLGSAYAKHCKTTLGHQASSSSKKFKKRQGKAKKQVFKMRGIFWNSNGTQRTISSLVI